jgi:hypothetical protein
MGRGKEEVSVIIRRQPEKNNNDLSLTGKKQYSFAEEVWL